MAMTSSPLISSLFKVVTKSERLVRTYIKEGRWAFFPSSDGLILTPITHHHVKAISSIIYAS